ncbi:MAG: hypothetical protein EOP86_19915 [Verrucomicrobiaceae bacterium]|nr:MAG: hypothetical protein EOP86_19915 [Verrucomicrobiaceae bacterium]
MTKLTPPTDCNLTHTCREISERHGVSLATAHRWKTQAGIPMKRGGRGVRRASLGLWGKLRRSDWEKGYPYVASLMGVSRQAVHQMWERLAREGQELPKLKRGRPRKTCV